MTWSLPSFACPGVGLLRLLVLTASIGGIGLF